LSPHFFSISLVACFALIRLPHEFAGLRTFESLLKGLVLSEMFTCQETTTVGKCYRTRPLGMLDSKRFARVAELSGDNSEARGSFKCHGVPV
jgi:hypothetical protein